MIETEVRRVILPQKRCSNHLKSKGASKGSAGLRKTFVCLSFFNVFEEPKTHFGDLPADIYRNSTEGCRPARYGGGGGRRPAGRASAVRGQVSAGMTWKSIPFRYERSAPPPYLFSFTPI